MKKLKRIHHFSVDEIFEIIECYANGLLHHVREEEPVPQEVVMETSKRIIEILRDTNVEGRVGIVILLNAACALYEVAMEQENTIDGYVPPCPKHLN